MLRLLAVIAVQKTKYKVFHLTFQISQFKRKLYISDKPHLQMETVEMLETSETPDATFLCLGLNLPSPFGSLTRESVN